MSETKPEKKSRGCLFFFTIIILFAVCLYFTMPKIISIVVNNEEVAELLPENVKENLNKVQEVMSENIEQIEELGISKEKVIEIIEKVDPEKIINYLEDIKESDSSDVGELLEIASKHIELSEDDIDILKEKLQDSFSKDDMEKAVSMLLEKADTIEISFPLLKESIIDMIKNQE